MSNIHAAVTPPSQNKHEFCPYPLQRAHVVGVHAHFLHSRCTSRCVGTSSEHRSAVHRAHMNHGCHARGVPLGRNATRQHHLYKAGGVPEMAQKPCASHPANVSRNTVMLEHYNRKYCVSPTLDYGKMPPSFPRWPIPAFTCRCLPQCRG